MTIRYSKINKLWKMHKSYYTKRWFKNMDNRVLNYLHIGEEFHMKTINMNKKCRIDRVGYYAKIWRMW